MNWKLSNCYEDCLKDLGNCSAWFEEWLILLVIVSFWEHCLNVMQHYSKSFVKRCRVLQRLQVGRVSCTHVQSWPGVLATVSRTLSRDNPCNCFNHTRFEASETPRTFSHDCTYQHIIHIAVELNAFTYLPLLILIVYIKYNIGI